MFSTAQILVSFGVFFSSSYASLMVALIFSGFFNCMVMNPSFALLSEISVIRYRSSVASLNTLMSNLGWLIGISLGLVVPLQFYSLALAFPSLLFLMVCPALVESPIWLLRCSVETSHWSRSIQMLPSDWLESWWCLCHKDKARGGLSLCLYGIRHVQCPPILQCLYDWSPPLCW